MTYREELERYAKRCLSDVRISDDRDYISCQKHKWACERFLNDLNKSKQESFLYYWDEEEAGKIVKWFSYLRHSKGILAGKPIELNEFQKFYLCQLYGWRNKKTGLKRFKKSFIEVGRKNAKSQMEAGQSLYEISTQSVKNNESYEYYTAGVKRDQSKIILEEAKLMLRNSPLRTKFKITRDSITHIKTGSFIKALSKDDGKSGDGTNPAGLILDEYHQHRNTDFYDLGLGSNTKESMLIIITTAGMDLNVPCYNQEYKYASNILNPDIDVENDEYFVDIFEVEESDIKNIANLENERLWYKANPVRMSYKEGRDKIREEYKIAKEIPEKMTAFLTKCMNIWVQRKNDGYMDMAKWRKCKVKKLPIDLYGMSCYVGFDMSAKIDLTSVTFVIPWKNGDKIKYLIISHSFVPNMEKLMERKAVDKAPYDDWERRGYITVTNSQIVDQGAVMDYVLRFAEEHGLEIEMLCFDPANASKLMMDLSDRGYDVVEVYQSYKSLNESTAGFREQVYEGNVICLENPVLDFAMANAVTRTNNGLIKIDKDAATARIDPVDSTLCGFKLAMYHEFQFDIMDDIDEFLDEDF